MTKVEQLLLRTGSQAAWVEDKLSRIPFERVWSEDKKAGLRAQGFRSVFVGFSKGQAGRASGELGQHFSFLR
jgi:hypothetical protein